jgi:hypothetical protein
MDASVHSLLVPEFICEYQERVLDLEGYPYLARVYAVPQGEGIWAAWIVFFPEDASGGLRRTEAECEEASLGKLAAWAARLTPEYLAGALERSHPFGETGAYGPQHIDAAPL